MKLSLYYSLAAVVALAGVVALAQQPKPKLYNTAKQKLLDGKQVFSFTQSTADVADYCERSKHYDFTWFEMQHSTLEFKDVEKMIAACPHTNATPMIRLPDAQEWHIQHTTDIGNLGVIFPTRSTMSIARARPPNGHGILRRRGAAQARGRPPSIWGINGINYPPDHQRQHAGCGDD